MGAKANRTMRERESARGCVEVTGQDEDDCGDEKDDNKNGIVAYWIVFGPVWYVGHPKCVVGVEELAVHPFKSRPQ